jgi:GNAT superfamily N-acetyltransferase
MISHSSPVPSATGFLLIDPREIFQQYRTERRAQSYAGFHLEVLPHLSRYVAEMKEATGTVTFTDTSSDAITGLIDEQIAYFGQIPQDFEWKVHDFDSPANLHEVLRARGFEQSDEEAFLVLDPSDWRPAQRAVEGLRIERITDSRQLRDFVVAEQAIWRNDNLSWHVQKYADELARDPSSISIYCAYVNHQPVGTGRVSFAPDSAFAQLNGGGVSAAMRGRGIFSALLTHRIEEAKRRGYRWLAVDAAPMSRPILLRKGFQHVCWTYPMMHRFRPSLNGASTAPA